MDRDAGFIITVESVSLYVLRRPSSNTYHWLSTVHRLTPIGTYGLTVPLVKEWCQTPYRSPTQGVGSLAVSSSDRGYGMSSEPILNPLGLLDCPY